MSISSLLLTQQGRRAADRCLPVNEFELIRHYFAAARCAQGGDGVVRGIGDDCALLALPAGEQLAVSLSLIHI